MTATIAVPTTPTIRSATRKSLFWILAVVFVVLIAVIGLAFTGASKAGTPFSATNAGPTGSMAVAEVLRQQGVDVTVSGSLAATRTALDTTANSTLFLYDANRYLSEEQLRSVAALANHVVVLSPDFSQLTALAPEVGAAGVVNKKSLSSDCTSAAVNKAGVVTGAGNGYRLVVKDASATLCLGSGKNVFSLINIERGTRTITVLGTTDALSNEHVADRGNAALALNLLGDNAKLVWYLPTIDDTAVSGEPSIAALTPPWVSSVMTLLVLVAIAAAFWRGRRMGPLVIENLPVVVRASETMEGRARLYQKGAARRRALDSLRIGAIDRLAVLCGLPRLATVEEVIGAVSAITARDQAGIRSLLFEAVPGTDRDLVRLSDELLELERAVARDIRPS